MEALSEWILLGFMGWILLIVFRTSTEGLPKFDAVSYAKGFFFALLLGPWSILFFIYLLVTRWLNRNEM